MTTYNTLSTQQKRIFLTQISCLCNDEHFYNWLKHYVTEAIELGGMDGIVLFPDNPLLEEQKETLQPF